MSSDENQTPPPTMQELVTKMCSVSLIYLFLNNNY